MSSLDRALALLTRDGDDFVIDAPEAWAQGRTLYGGITAAFVHHAARQAIAALPPLRSAQFTFVGPAAGRLRIRPALLRRGRSTAIVAADCLNEDGLAARATFSFAAGRDSAVAHDRIAAPPVPPPDACPAFGRTAAGLSFLDRLESRHAAGSHLFDPGRPPEFTVWVRLSEGDAADPVTTLLAIADALPPPAMVSFPRPAPISTVSWSIDFHRPPDAAGGWRLLTATSESAADGYSLQSMRLFDEAGALIASGRQLVAIFI